jgi:hypothetical protein
MASANESRDVRQPASGGDFSVLECAFFEAAEQIEAGAIEIDPDQDGWWQIALRLRSRLIAGGAVMTALLVVGGGLAAGGRQDPVPAALVQVESPPPRALPPAESPAAAPTPTAVPAPAAVASEGYRLREHGHRRGGHHKRR